MRPQHIHLAMVRSVSMPLQAVYQQWPSTYAVAACTQLALHYMDDVSLTEEVLLEPAKVAVVMEGGPATPSQQQGVKETPEVQASALPLSMSQRQLSWPRPEPCPLGVCVQARWGPPSASCQPGSPDGNHSVTRKNGTNNNGSDNGNNTDGDGDTVITLMSVLMIDSLDDNATATSQT